MKKISFSSSLCFLFIFFFFRVWVLCFRTINEKKNCTGSGICIISLWISIYAAAASTTTATRPLPHHTHSIRIFFLSCFASSDIWGASKTREMKQEVKIDFLHFIRGDIIMRACNYALTTMSFKSNYFFEDIWLDFLIRKKKSIGMVLKNMQIHFIFTLEDKKSKPSISFLLQMP